MSFLSELMTMDAGHSLSAQQCSALLRQLERQFKTGPGDPEKPMRIQGQDELVHRLVMAVVLNEHVLLEGLPGVAKTTAVELLARDTGMTCRRVQFVPDMQPTDLIGKDQINLAALSSSTDETESGFRYWENGPLFQNIVIADEINRAPAKVQAALLESMAERSITPFGKTRFVIRSRREWNMWLRWIWNQPIYKSSDVWGTFWPDLPDSGTTSALSDEIMQSMGHALAEQHWDLFGSAFPWRDRSEAGEPTFGATSIDLRNPKDAQFAVFATMNPIEQEGTYPLSEAQTDRFCFKTLVKYPSYTALQSITRMINPPSSGLDPDINILSGATSGDESIRRSLYFVRRCREIMFGPPGEQANSLMAGMFSGSSTNGALNAIDVVSRVVFYSHLRQPEPGSRRTQQLTQLLKDPEQIERQARLMREDQAYAELLKEDIWQFVKSGASPRAQMFLVKAAVCESLMNDDGDLNVGVQHIRDAAHDVLRHRIRMNVQAHVRGIHPEDVVDVLMQRFAPITTST